MEAEVRNAVSEARREAQAQHSVLTKQLEQLRLEAENEAAQAHELLANETASLKATRREVSIVYLPCWFYFKYIFIYLVFPAPPSTDTQLL